MSKRTLTGLVVGAVCVALLVGGVAVASNMGFKYVASVTANKSFNVALPWNNNYTNAQSLLTDTGAVSVQRLTEAKVLQTWSGTGVNFTITKAEGYILNAGAGGLTPTLVGSHDPNFLVDFPAGSFNFGTPYHTTLTNAGALLSDLQAVDAGFASVQRLTEDKVLQTWNGTTGVNFSLTLGESHIVNHPSGATGYAAPHY
jgi:hypothetical protein